MTLFRKVFSQADEVAPGQIRNSYDLAMAPEPDGLVEMEDLASLLEDTKRVEEAEDDNLPNADAVAEAQSLIEAAKTQNQATLPSKASQNPQGRRNKTRLLGFNASADETLDPLHSAAEGAANAPQKFAVGWLAIVDGAGLGQCFTLYSGVAAIGRGDDQAIQLDFGDTSISRQSHAAIAFDPEQSKFFLGHGGKSNIIRLNDQPVLSTEEIKHGDTLRIGETTLKLVALCDDSFQWTKQSA